MGGKTIGAVLGVVGVFLWFMPFAEVGFMGMNAYQAGNHIGGIAYLLLFSSLAYAALSWMEQHVPCVIAASVALAICLLFAVQAGTSVAWGLIAFIVISTTSIVLALWNILTAKKDES